MAIVTPTDRPKSFRNRCVIEVCVVTLLVGFSVGVVAFAIELIQISSVLSYIYSEDEQFTTMSGGWGTLNCLICSVYACH